MNKLFSLFDLLDTTGDDCRLAALSQISDYEDAVMVETAVRCGADCIVTRNSGDYSPAPIPVYSPCDFLKKIKIDYTN